MHKDYKRHTRKIILIIALVINIGLFFYFKYTNFMVDNINVIFKTDFFVEKILLPLGISFFSFQQVSYLIDTYRKEVPNYTFINYATFVAFFPQLIAGPIVLHNELVPQFSDISKKSFNFDNFSKGLMAFAFGLAKKVLIADFAGKIVLAGYSDIPSLSTISAIVVIFSYTIQIYFDFSGYCDMATGIGLMFNINIPMNFNSPYKSLTIMEFWQRWHMTLTRFFKKYLYFPLGGNRKGKLRTYTNIMIVFLVSGFWHGANWTFILWGAIHGVGSVFTRIFDKYIKKIPKAINWCVTFVFVNIAWVYFRAPSIFEANQVIKKVISFRSNNLLYGIDEIFKLDTLFKILNSVGHGLEKIAAIPLVIFIFIYIVLALFALIKMKNTNERIEDFKPNMWNLVISSVLLFLSIISLSGVSTFLYYNF
ncbi:MAG: MBOAT family O-acyltransferase [Eubacteriales bacterium]